MTIVASFAMSHAPGMLAWPERAESEQRERLFDGYRTAGDRLNDLDLDAIVLVTGEHFANFFSFIPPFCIHLGATTEGPIEPWLGPERRTIPTHAALAHEILARASEAGRDIAFSHELVLDHGSIVPLELLGLSEIPLVPVIVNTLVEPLPSLESCRLLGSVIGDVLQESDLRVGLIGAGGLSHWPGMAEAGRMSPQWDRAVLDGLAAGHREVLWELPEAGLSDAGPGAEEIRAWTVVGAATPPAEAEILGYETIDAWATGCAVVDLYRMPTHVR